MIFCSHIIIRCEVLFVALIIQNKNRDTLGSHWKASLGAVFSLELLIAFPLKAVDMRSLGTVVDQRPCMELH